MNILEISQSDTIDVLQTMQVCVNSICKAQISDKDKQYFKETLIYNLNILRNILHSKIKPVITEAVYKVPLSDADFELVKTLLGKPIPAIVASIYIDEIIDDDELAYLLNELAENSPNDDVRPIIADWFKRVMPDQLHRLGLNIATELQRSGEISPIHGYDPEVYSGTSNNITGNAYGRY